MSNKASWNSLSLQESVDIYVNVLEATIVASIEESEQKGV
jgi:hypothetical protein